MKRTAWVVFAVLVSLAWTRGGTCAWDIGLTMQAIAGFDGYCRSDGWCPVYVVLSNEGADIEGELRIAVGDFGAGAEPDVYARPVILPARSRKAYLLYVPSADAYSRSKLTVELHAGDEAGRDVELLAQQVTVSWLDDADWLYGVASSSASALNFLSSVAPGGGVAKVAHLDPATLPPDPLGWEGLDVLVLSDVDTTVLSGVQRQALETWVVHGGHLIVGGGAGAARTVAGVADLLPVAVGGTRSVDSLWALGEQVSAPVAAGPYAVAEADLRGGEVLITQEDEQDGLILLARRSCGVGQVDFLAFDAGLNPFTHWNDNGLLWGWIIGTKSAAAQRFTVRNGYNAREAVNAIPGLEVPSTLQLLAFMLIYTLLIGPVNYVILRRLDRRELAWLTIPALVVGFTVCAYVTGFQIRGGTAIVHRLAVVYVPEGASAWPGQIGRRGRVSEVVGLFSPRRTTYDVWVGGTGVREIPAAYYDGPDAQPLHVTGDAEGSTVTNLRVDVGGIQPFFAEGYADVPGIEADLRLVGDAAGDLRLEGTLGTRGIPLKEAVLIAGRDEQRLGDLEAGEEANVYLLLQGGAGVVAPTPYPPVGPYGYVAPYGYDIPEQILGPGDYWGDRELYRRYQFLQALFPYDGPGLRPGVYLVGWAEEQVPLPVEVVEWPFSTVETALYVYALPVVGLEPGAAVIIPPGLIVRQVEETTGDVSMWPGGFHMGPGAEIVLRFTVLPGLSVQQVDELILDLQGTSYGNELPTVSLWSKESSGWESLSIGWGQHSIPDAGSYVLPPGDVLVRLEMGVEWSADVESLRITIKGRR